MGEWLKQISTQPAPDPVEIFVVNEDGGWRIRVGETITQPHLTETDAIREAMDGARQLAAAGVESRVVMRLLTCPFHPRGMGRAFPTVGRAWARSRQLSLLSPR
jgi:hypothetical protein